MSEFASLYWIGVKESELYGVTQLFNGSITTYGSNSGTNRAFDKHFGFRFDCNTDNNEWIAFVNNTAQQIIDEDNLCRFMLYYPADIPYYCDQLKRRLVYVNDHELTALLENKIHTRLWLADCVLLPPFLVTEGKHIKLSFLKRRFPEYSQFVVQADSSCSGNGTWLFTENTESDILSGIVSSGSYTVSPYIQKSVPLNTHIIIYEREIVMLPPSVQIISTKHNTFCYYGADFIAYRQLAPSIHNKVAHYATAVGNRLRAIGYRGVCGVDFITDGHDIYFMEVNSRFQSSTMLLNRALEHVKAGASVQQLHMDAFTRPACSYKLPTFEVDYSFYCYKYHEDGSDMLSQLYAIQKSAADTAICIDDQLDWDMQLQPHCYLFGLIFQQNILAISPENTCILHPNVDLSLGIIGTRNWIDNLHALKIMLLNRGVRISSAAERHLLITGGLNYKEFEAVDMVLQDIYICVPYGTKMSRFSPFEICLNDNGEYELFYWGKRLVNVTLRTQDALGSNMLNSGFRFDQIAYLGHDRLRVYHRNSCYYKDVRLGCGFCDIEQSERQFSLEDIMTVVDAYDGHPAVRHYMIGGGSNAPDCDFSRVIDIAAYIRSKTDKPINLMTTPPYDTKTLIDLHRAGITEVTFNLEVFDRDLAKQYMPGKGVIPLRAYEEAFAAAVRLWGTGGNVRTALIVGLEPIESLLRGVDFACRLGVWPILSLLKPIEGTRLEHMLPPSDEDVLTICGEAITICQTHGVGLAPVCRCCEDNTLKITLKDH